MNEQNQSRKKNAGLLGVICGSLLMAIPLSPLPGVAKPLAQVNPSPSTPGTVLNPNPSIFNEPPYNRGGTSVTTPSVSPTLPDQMNPPVTTPLPENRSQPIARVMPMDGMVEVRLKNNTNAVITYEAVGHTQRRTLAGQEETVLQGVPTPVTITTVRQDEGLLKITPTSTTEQGVLEVSLDEEKSLVDTLSP